MEFEGTVKNGVIVMDDVQHFPEGARVKVRLEEQSTQLKPTLAEKLLKLAGTVPDLPPDFAEQHDHYIHGTPKR